ncbi:prostaglandin E synthase 2 [Aplysia californica]|uniref:Prostaglandin E synthase 2 n=1 Tax=Aplysia californica TaxID=6500 RepID=A0ABM0J9Z0_APLCA|nr:prostaglandin E synthase 2 [Aplysia californica]
MAAPFNLQGRLLAAGKISKSFVNFQNVAPKSFRQCRTNVRLYSSRTENSRKFNIKIKPALRVTALVLGGSYALRQAISEWNRMKVYAGDQARPPHAPSRQVRVDTDHSGLKLTLYQYQTCPFCCKVRAVLDYHGFSYDVVEVNSVTKKELKWSEYKKVPILIAEVAGSKEEVALHDSTVVVSILESYLHDRSTSLQKLNSYYPCLTEKVGRKTKYDFPNKYFVMFQEKADLGSTAKERSEERKWRKWADDHMVHMLSPNAYRTMRESLQSFNYFSEVGEWEKNFSFFERMMVIYVGAAVMYVMGIILKYKYELKDDVRQSLYDACNEWVKAIGKNKQFMGGNQPNLADLAVYGVLNSIEGCAAFQDALKNSKIGPWYRRTKDMVASHQGANPLHSKTQPSETHIAQGKV